MMIRHYHSEDAAALSDLYRASVMELGRRHYSAAQVAAWLSLTPDPVRLDRLAQDGRLRLVAVDEVEQDSGTTCTQYLGFADLERDGHLHFLYVAPAVAGAGVASTLCTHLERHAAENHLPRLFVEASEAASRLFVTRGFTIIKRNDIDIAGVMIHNYDMEKWL
ncbi:hypothetical protein GCM10011505_31670 [Tistrella bauzanensis]|uniref:N-acetyltransferase domain-containing protein n=1 Tax=Tistrella bauzanensis TaxID=657419 RepID=A0ABQ1IR78_9PROT|nr:GNAT family N-acetyltransferase [Tistrella bauzanensis]GGB48302.1 hypothetical protein GCM10011505_31670 [Tistrella bauzanensis]